MRIIGDGKLLIGATLFLILIFMFGSKTFAATEFKLLASDGVADDRFGAGLSVSGDMALVSGSGKVYVFRWNGSNWVEKQKLLASDGAAGGIGGDEAVSISGNVALVGAEDDDDNGDESGSAYVYFIKSTPTSDIKANTLDGPITISNFDTFSATVALRAGDFSSVICDWWCVAQTPWDWYSYDYDSDQWIKGLQVTYMGPCADIPTTEVLNMKLPVGDFIFYFGVDDNMNGTVDGNLHYDSVNVTVEP